MYFTEAVDVIRDKAMEYPVSLKKSLWSTILEQVGKRDACDGQLVDTLEKIIKEFLAPLDDGMIISLWKQTETGWAEEDQAENIFPDCLRMDVQMELLKQITEMAWDEAEEKVKKRTRKRRGQ